MKYYIKITTGVWGCELSAFLKILYHALVIAH